MRDQDASALGIGLFWYAEKLNFGYEDTAPDHVEALRLYRQAADLNVTDALIRAGEMHERGRGIAKSPTEAVRYFVRAAEAGNVLGHARIAGLLSRHGKHEKAAEFWGKFLD